MGVERFEVGPDDRLSNHAPLHFDLSIFDLYVAAMASATVVLVPSGLSVFPVQIRDFIDQRKITIWYSVPSILSMLTLRGGLQVGALPGLRTILFAGEVFPTKYLRQLMTLLPHVRFFNLYGPTETNVCTYFEVASIPEPATEPIPIGRSIDGVEVFGVTDDGRAAEPGEVGELFVHGPTVMRGYWGDAERTGRSLVRDPTGRFHQPVYRTGDLVRQRANGDYRLSGRRDHQIKSRGYRIELGEVESRDPRPSGCPGMRGDRRPRRAGYEPDPRVRGGPQRSRPPRPIGVLREPDPPSHGPGALRAPGRATEDLERQGRPSGPVVRVKVVGQFTFGR